MALYKSIVNTTYSDVDHVDNRPTLFYNKYQYRARVTCDGVSLLYYCKTPADVRKNQQRHKRWQDVNPDELIAILEWKNQQAELVKKKEITIRTEYDTFSVFSNDLAFLKTLKTLGLAVDFTIVDPSIPEGTMYFIKEPEHKYRFYLKSKRVPDDFHVKLSNFFDRYKDSDSKIVPSNALKTWLKAAKNPNQGSFRWWKTVYLSSSYYIDYDDESMLTMFMIMFDGCVSRKYKLEKRPTTT
jgi:hypothetical protein